MNHKFRESGDSFYKIRKKRNLTQKEMGKLLQIHPQFISNIERGLCALPFEAFSPLTKEEGLLYLGSLLFDRIFEARREVAELRKQLGI